MRILAVSHEFPPIGGGGANACLFLTKGLVERGHQVTLITANYNGMPEEEIINGVQLVRVNSKRAHKEHCSFMEMLDYLRKALPLAVKMQKQKAFDLCFVFFGIPSGPIGYMLKRRFQLPYIIRFGGGDIPGFQERFTKVYRLIGPAIKAIWKQADALVANSAGLKKMALDFWDKKDFRIICNGVDTDMFCPGNDHENGDTYRILFVSRLIERKGLQYVIPHLKEMEEHTGKKISLTIVGDGPYRARLEELASEHGVSSLTTFVGQKDKSEIVAFYQDADLFILPSAKEGMPNVVLEAMSCGLPVVMTPCQGSEELISGNGYIADIAHFTEKMEELIVNQELSKQMGQQSRRVILEQFSWNHAVIQYEKLMEECVKQR
ncbi:MAG: glycosyltransferase family 4 protein [Agathobacter sp.]